MIIEESKKEKAGEREKKFWGGGKSGGDKVRLKTPPFLVELGAR